MSGTAIDKEALKAKYREERDKRLRADGNEQYQELKGQLAHYAEDPYTPVAERAAKHDHVTVAFIGGGFAGLATGARLTERVAFFKYLDEWRNTGAFEGLEFR